jgi:hypothetical protein
MLKYDVTSPYIAYKTTSVTQALTSGDIALYLKLNFVENLPMCVILYEIRVCAQEREESMTALVGIRPDRRNLEQEIARLSTFLVECWNLDSDTFERGHFVRLVSNFSCRKTNIKEQCIALLETVGSGEKEAFVRMIDAKVHLKGNVYILSREGHVLCMERPSDAPLYHGACRLSSIRPLALSTLQLIINALNAKVAIWEERQERPERRLA